LGDFHVYLIEEENKIKKYKNNSSKSHLFVNQNNNRIEWIEKLLETPVEDGRKTLLWKILCPYLVNIKKLDDEQCYKILKTWLEKCNKLRKLEFDSDSEIKTKLTYVKYYNPISIEKLKTNNKKMYLLLIQKLNQ
jgi:hypothetical protein